MTAPYWEAADATLYHADSRTAWRDLPKQSVHAIVCSPPYWGLRDYGVPEQLGLESTPRDYIDGLADLLDAWGRHVMRDDGSLWLNLGDTYSSSNGWQRDPNGTSKLDGSSQAARFRGATSQVAATHNAQAAGLGDYPAKSLLMIPERVALALMDRGWLLRNKVVWSKPNAMPTSATDRLATKWEYMFHLTRAPRYYYDLEAIGEPVKHPEKADGTIVFGGRRKAPDGKYDSATRIYGSTYGYRPADGRQHRAPRDWRNPGDCWQINTQPFTDAHFAVMPPELVRRPILATVPEGGTVADPFAGAGTTAVMARRLGRRSVLCELNEEFCDLISRRLAQGVLTFDEGDAA